MAEVITSDRRRSASGQGLTYALAQKVLNAPLALTSEHAALLQGALKGGQFDANQIVFGPSASKFVGKADSSSNFRVTEDGVAIVAIGGMLLDRGGWLGDLYGLATTYEGLAEQFRRLTKDDAVKSVVLDIDSPGGMCAGLFDLVSGELATLKRKKRVYGLAANMAASAAYALGSACHELYVSKFGCAGSIGVIMIHQSYAELLANAGIETTIIQSGSRKSDGNPFQALSHGARASFSEECDQAYAMFVAHVAKSRDLDEDTVRSTEARTYYGQRAVEAGLCDGVMSIEGLLAHIRSGKPGGKPATKKGGRMSTEQQAAAPDYAALAAGIMAAMADQKKTAKAEAPAPAAPVAAQVPAQPAGPSAADMRARIKSILDSEPAKTRGGLANHLALETDMPAEQAIAILNAAPAEAKDEPGAAFMQRMRQPGASAGVKPEAAGGDKRPSLAEKARTWKSRNRPDDDHD